MDFAFVYKTEILGDKKYYILEDLALCNLDDNKINILSGKIKDSVIYSLNDELSFGYEGEIISFEELKEFYQEENLDSILQKFVIDSHERVFILNENNELIEIPEIEYIKYKVIDKIKGQDQQIEEILSIIFNNLGISEENLEEEKIEILKRNIILSGPVGTGKTEIMKQIAKALELPIVFYDMSFVFTSEIANEYAKILERLFEVSENDLELASKGIIVIDNFEEINHTYSFSTPKLISKIIQNEFIKLMSGHKVPIKVGEEIYSFDTSRLTIVFAGNSSKIKADDTMKNSIGFSTSEKDIENSLISAGFSERIMHKITDIIQLDKLTKEEYKSILLTSSISPLMLKLTELQNLGINIELTEDFIDYIATEAEQLNLGFYGLNKIINKIFRRDNFDLLSGKCDAIKLEKNSLVRVRK